MLFFKSNKVTRQDIRKPVISASNVAAEPTADEKHDTDKDELSPGSHTFTYDDSDYEIDDDAPTLKFQR